MTPNSILRAAALLLVMSTPASPLAADVHSEAGRLLAAAPAMNAVADTGTLYITGTAAVRVDTDRVRLRLAVETEAETAAEAASSNAEIAERVLAALRARLGEEDRLETSAYRIDPLYARAPNEALRVTGYRVSNEVVATTADVEGLGELLDAATRAGATRVSDLSFFAADVSEAREAAIREAVANARAEATVTAEALGVQLGDILLVNTSAAVPQPRRASAVRFDEMAMAAPPIEAGSETLTVSVTVHWRILQGGGR